MLAKELLKLSSENLRVPTAQELLLYDKGNGKGPQIADFVLDLGSNGIVSSWNKKAAELFASEFVSRKVSPCTDLDMIQKVFNTYLLALQIKYKNQVLAASSDEAAKVSGRDTAKQRARYNRRSYVSSFLVNDSPVYDTHLETRKTQWSFQGIYSCSWNS